MKGWSFCLGLCHIFSDRNDYPKGRRHRLHSTNSRHHYYRYRYHYHYQSVSIISLDRWIDG